jgi:predicted ATPase
MRKPDWVIGPKGRRPGWHVPDEALPIAAENIHSNYEDIDSLIEFTTSNKGRLTLYFPATGGCIFFADEDGSHIRGTGELRRLLPQDIQVVPILGPLEHEEQIVSEETVRKNLMTTRASRHFRNYWYYAREGFSDFARLVSETWPGMTIEQPERTRDILVMFCREHRISRELYWAGFGFQIWLQLLTHISRANGATLLVVDEPEVYLHPDVQRQLLGILRGCDCDVLLATHSTEIMSEADPSEIVLVDKTKRSARRLRDIEEVQGALEAVGSIQNITLTRLARNKRLAFVEGDSDFVIMRRFARQLGMSALAAGTDLTALDSGGFSSWQEIKALAMGFERALGVTLQVAAVYDRDYWCEEQLTQIRTELAAHLSFSHIHARKEIENYLLVPSVLARALEKAVQERNRRASSSVKVAMTIAELLNKITEPMQSEIQAQYISKRLEYFSCRGLDAKTITVDALKVFHAKWKDLPTRMEIVPGKSVLRELRSRLAELYGVTLTDHKIVSEFQKDEVPADMLELLQGLEGFRSRH